MNPHRFPDFSGNQSPSQTHAAHDPRSPRTLWIAMLAIPLVIMLAVSSFAWPAARMEPRNLSIGVIGPVQATNPIAAALEDSGLDVERYGDEDAVREAIEDRDIYGALMLSPDGVTLFTASAASPVVAQMLQQAASTQLAAAPDAQPARLTVVDVVPTDPDDPRGAVLGASVMPLVLAGMITGVALSIVSAPGLRQMSGLLATSVLVGLTVTLVIQSWLGAIGGTWWVNATVLSLLVLAISSVVAGFRAALGPAGLGLAGVLMLFVGNPWSGITSAPELMPQWVSVTGQLLPPGAGGQLLRSTAFFDGAGAWWPLLVLLGWIALGMLAIWYGVVRQPAQQTVQATSSGIGPSVARSAQAPARHSIDSALR